MKGESRPAAAPGNTRQHRTTTQLPRRPNRLTGFQVAQRVHAALLRDWSEAFPQDELVALLDITGRTHRAAQERAESCARRWAA